MKESSVICCLFLFIFCKTTVQQNKPSAERFPETWCGLWSGKLMIYTPHQIDTIDMLLHIAQQDQDHFQWKIIYGRDTIAGARKYVLIRSTTNEYVIDEGNGIRLTTTYFPGTLWSRFSVMNALLDCKYQVEGDKMIFEIISGKEIFTHTTGDTIFNKDTIPIVRNFALRNYQKAELFRKK